jgi:hypothetical protein
LAGRGGGPPRRAPFRTPYLAVLVIDLADAAAAAVDTLADPIDPAAR